MGRIGRLYKTAFEETAISGKEIVQGGTAMDDEERRKLREEIMKELDERQQVTDEELYDIIDRRILEYGQISFLPLKDKKELRGRLFDSFRRLGVLQELVDDEDVTEIMVNGADHVFVEKNGRMEQWVRALTVRSS